MIDLGPLHDSTEIIETFRDKYPSADWSDLEFDIDGGMIFIEWIDRDQDFEIRRFRVMYEGLNYNFEEAER